MRLVPSLQRLTLAALIASAGLATVASSAGAESWHWYKTHGRGPAFVAPRPFYGGRVVVRDRGPGPALAGLIGGFVLGAALTHPQPVVVRERVVYEPAPACDPGPVVRESVPTYRYEDAWGDRWWDTLDECTDAARADHGPRVIKVVDDETNQVVRTLYWKHDHWISDDDDGD